VSESDEHFNPRELSHLTAASVTGVKVTDTPLAGQYTTGYGPKIPTAYMLKIGTRWHRVYVVNYGNVGSTYVLVGGVNHYLSSGVELILETVRDGGTLETALDAMQAWPVWMRESEGLGQ
jgi:hypothetical protein